MTLTLRPDSPLGLRVRDLNLRDAADEVIFAAAKVANAVVITKDKDFVNLLMQQGAPPQVANLSIALCDTDMKATCFRLILLARAHRATETRLDAEECVSSDKRTA
ncbi:DUF5615 family PIN-like protein [Bdellovibrionota bacterium FG-1]